MEKSAQKVFDRADIVRDVRLARLPGLELHVSIDAPPHFTMESVGMGHHSHRHHAAAKIGDHYDVARDGAPRDVELLAV